MLSDADSRAAYDRYGFDGLKGRPHDRLRRTSASATSSTSSSAAACSTRCCATPAACGARPAAARRRRAATTSRRAVELDLAEAVFGVTKEVEVKADVACETCDGQRRAARHRARDVPAVPRQRAHARGLQPGRLRPVHPHQHLQRVPRPGHASSRSPCETCRGTGSVRGDAHRHGRGPGRHRRRAAPAPRAARAAPARQGGRPGDLYVADHASSRTSTSCATATTSSTGSTSP